MPAQIAAALTTEDVRRAYYNQLGPGQDWWWIRELQLDPLALIVDDDEGGLWRVPVTVSGDDVTFAAPEAVRVEYVAASAADPTSATPTPPRRIVFADRAASREGVSMDPTEYRRLLGLPDDATDEAVRERAAALLARPEPTDEPAPEAPPVVEPATPPAPVAEQPPAPAPVTTPEGTVLVDAGQWQEMLAGVAAGRAAAETLARQDEDAFVGRVRASGRLGPATNPHSQRLEASLRREWQRNRGEAEAVAAGLAVVAPTAPIGHDGGEGETGIPGHWGTFIESQFPEVAAARRDRERQNGGR